MASPPLKIDKFGGMIPAWDDRLVPEDQAVLARDTYLYSGSCIGWRQPKLLHTLQSSTSKSAYRIPIASQATASGNLLFLGTPDDGDTVTIGEVSYTFRTHVSSQFDVLIDPGGQALVTANNFLAAITLDRGTKVNLGVLYGIGTCENAAVSDSDTTVSAFDPGTGTVPMLQAVAPEFGAAFNIINISTTGSNLTWQPNPLIPGQLQAAATTYTGGTNATADLSITGDSVWLEFDDPDTDVLRSPVFDDQFNRYYWASPTKPPQYNTLDRIANNQSPWLLGVPAPGCAPGLAVTGGGTAATVGSKVQNPVGFVTSGIIVDPITHINSTASFPIIVLIPITRNVGDGNVQLNSINAMPNASFPDANFMPIVFQDAANTVVPTRPGLLLQMGEVVTAVTADTPMQGALTEPVGLFEGQTYWIGFVIDTALGFYVTDLVTRTAVFTAAPETDVGESPGDMPTAAVLHNMLNPTMWGDCNNDAIFETRSYVYTWLTAYNEEGPPSPPETASGYTNSTWTITPFTPPPSEMGEVRNIVGLRIYRTVTATVDPQTGETSTAGATGYFFVADPSGVPVISKTILPGAGPGDYPVTQAEIVDTLTDDIIANNGLLPSVSWYPPPENLQGMTVMANGMIAGFKGNEIWFCEQYRPHAWPAGYVQVTQFPVIGLGVVGQSLIACTAAWPVVFTGANPSSISELQVKMPEPCLSKGSVVSTDAGVFYSSINGIIQVTGNGVAMNRTEQWITRDKWRSLTPSKNIRAVRQASSYFAYGTVSADGSDVSQAQIGFTVELASADATSFGIWPQAGGHRMGFSKLSAINGANMLNVLTDPWTGIGLVLLNQGVYYYDFNDPSPTIIPYLWRSKIFQSPTRDNYAALRVWYDVPPGSPVQASVPNNAAIQTLAANQYLIVRVYAATAEQLAQNAPLQLVTTRDVFRTGEILRIVSGFKADFWQFELEGRVNVSNIQIATSVRELGRI